MDQDQDLLKLRNLLALKRLETPMDSQVDLFLIELHRRQRAQLLVPSSSFAQGLNWIKERVAGLGLMPSLSYTSAFAAIALMAIVGLSQQVQVTQEAGHPAKLSLRMTGRDNAFAMIPSSFTGVPFPSGKAADSVSFSAVRPDATATTRFVLANNTSRANDATVAF